MPIVRTFITAGAEQTINFSKTLKNNLQLNLRQAFDDDEFELFLNAEECLDLGAELLEWGKQLKELEDEA